MSAVTGAFDGCHRSGSFFLIACSSLPKLSQPGGGPPRWKIRKNSLRVRVTGHYLRTITGDIKTINHNQVQQIAQSAVTESIGTAIAELTREGCNPGSRNDRILREPMRLLPIIDRLRAKMGTREDL
jgi:hypothetical protein